MSLPLQAVDRLFERLTATYGRQFLSLYEGLDANAIKSSWAHELSGFGGNLHAIAWALEHLPERAPNAIEFRNLCRRAPEPEVPRLPEPKADPARVAAELSKLGALAKRIEGSGGRPNTEWAHRIVNRSKAGERIAPAVLKMATDVVNRGQRRDEKVIDV
jgi:hypothetical protein